jgi:geranylgeranyl diphosphate synthase, type II
MKLPAFFDEDRHAVDAALERLMPPEDARPATIHRAMRYSVFAGGKRLRPILCLEAALMFDVNRGTAMHVACALEMIHTYSLIHDDLPALDNDDLRRGMPTCHKKFGEAMAILAGDGLLTLAFETLAGTLVSPLQRVRLIAEIAGAAGTRDGMVGGQVADVEATGDCAVTPELLEYIHKSKTAALIRASIVSGAIAGGAAEEDFGRLRRFGGQIGWAFQVTDDILDVEESSESLGKTAGKDQAQQKATYPALFGLAKSHEFARELAAGALAELSVYGERAARLRELGEFLVLRRA